MSWTVDSSGTQTADGSEDVLDSPTTNGTYVLQVDLSAMAVGDVVELRCYTTTLNGGTLRQCWKGTYDFYGASINAGVFSPFVPSDQQAKFTLKQVSAPASYKSFPWKVLRQ